MRVHRDTIRKMLAVTRRSAGLAGAALAAVQLCASAAVAQGVAVTEPGQPAIVAASMPGVEGSLSRVTTGAQMLHIVVGHSLFLSTKFRLHRVYITDPNVLTSMTLSPAQIIVTAMTPGVSSLVLVDEMGHAESYVVSSDIDVSSLRSALSQSVHDDNINVEGSGSRVILTGEVGSAAAADAAVKLASVYSKDVASSLTVNAPHPKQVRLKVRILEVDRTKMNQFGINLFNPGGNSNYTAGATTGLYPSTATLTQSTSATGAVSNTLTASNPLNFLLYSAKLNLGATVQDLESKQVLQILAEPTITTISGEKANFLAGGEFPFPMIQPGGGSGSTASVTVSFRPYGVKLEFTPTVNDDGTIRLKVAPEVSALDYTNAVTISGYTIPALSTRRAETEVELRSDQSFAISGLLDQRTTDIFSKTPGVASIPIIGALFKSKNLDHSTTELVVIVTPSLVDPLTDSTEPAQPGLPVPTLGIQKFDKSLGKNATPKPVVPPISSTESFSDGAVMQQPAAAPAAAEVQSGAKTTQGVSPSAAVKPSAAAATQSATQGPQKFVFDTPAAAATSAAAPAEKPSMIQIMALSHREDADAMVAALKRQGYNVAVNQDPGDSLLHLDVGPFSDKADEQAVLQRLLSQGYNATVK